MTFKVAIAEAGLIEAFREGKQALSNPHRRLVDGRGKFTGSINLDEALSGTNPDANRWDYGLGYRCGSERAVWVEVHPAHTSEVDTVILKLRWLRQWLRSESRDLEGITMAGRGSPWWWVATSGVHITRTSPQAKRLAKEGLSMPRERVVLD